MTLPEQPTHFVGEDGTVDHPARAKRTSVMLTAHVEQLGGQLTTSHRVRDLSVGGIRIDNAAALIPDATVLISVGSHKTIGATVKWVRDRFAGLEFVEPINLEAARTKAVIVPQTPVELAKHVVFKVSPGPTAGWIDEIRNPYRK